MRLGVVVVMAGCGRIGFEGDALLDAPTDDRLVLEVLADRPAGYWRFEDAPGVTYALDASGNGHDLEIAGRATLGVPGIRNFGVELAGGDPEPDGGQLLAGPAFQFGERLPFTLECWVKPHVLDTRWRMVYAFNYWNTETTRQGYTLDYQQQDFYLTRRRDSVEQRAETHDVLAEDRWVHVVATYDGATVGIYIDGVLRDSGPSTLSILPDPTHQATISNNVYAVNGVVDECAIYETGLSAGRIAAHHAAAL